MLTARALARTSSRALTALLLLAGCTAREPEGSNCQFNDECMEPLVCAGRFCRAACATARDCPSGWSCRVSDMRARNVCLPPPANVLCVVTEDCPGGAVCAQGNVCRWRCSDDAFCAGRSAGARCAGGLCTAPVTVSELTPMPLDAGTDASTDVAPLDAARDAAAEPGLDAPVDTAAQVDGASDVAVDASASDASPCAADGATTCELPNASATCRAGACAVVRCADGFGDCNRDARDGCEVAFATSPLHCGACGAACEVARNAREPVCVAGRCGVGACLAGFADCDPAPDSGCETSTEGDARNCGGCGVVCPTRPNATPACASGRCAITCAAGWGDCNANAGDGCEANLAEEAAHCGGCARACPMGESCARGVCVPSPFPSTGVDGVFDPAPMVVDGGTARTVVVLNAGVHNFTSIRIREQIVVQVRGDGVLDLRATGPVVIEGAVDVSGGAGRSIEGSPAQDDHPGGGTGGGHTGTATRGDQGTTTACGAPGGGGRGNSGTSAPPSAPNCGAGGLNGGGAGGATGRGGGGGGGYAGGGGGAGGDTTASAAGGDGARARGETGGAGGTVSARGGLGGGDASMPAAYRGGNGSTPTETFARCGGGGGGSIGAAAVADLRVTSATFTTGSAGGGGGGVHNTCPGPCRPLQGMGGGGAGGAVRIASAHSITLARSAAVRADGGAGGTTAMQIGGCPGGSGSGGVIYLSAPELRCDGCTLSAMGGPASANPYVGARGGAGGLGRIRMSTYATRCELRGAITPPLPMGSCAVMTEPQAGFAFVAAWPD